jgi:small neutral amino acid transporter SnatA (MarC family)
MVGCGESSGAPLALEFPHDFAYEFVTLLAVLDPTAAIPVFLAMTAGLSRKQSLLVATYAVGIAFLVLLFFIVVGQLLLEALRIPMTSFQLTGSLVLLLFGLKLVLGQVSEEAAAMSPNATLLERAIYPLAIPCITGTGSMLTFVLLTDKCAVAWRTGANHWPSGALPGIRFLHFSIGRTHLLTYWSARGGNPKPRPKCNWSIST